GQAAKLAKTYADSIEDRLQQKLDNQFGNTSASSQAIDAIKTPTDRR
ncbi:hypothetical protein F444_23056, partial [Phytophthora nicotianae P1976]